MKFFKTMRDTFKDIETKDVVFGIYFGILFGIIGIILFETTTCFIPYTMVAIILILIVLIF